MAATGGAGAALTQLPAAPLYADDPITFWTRTSLFIWGPLLDSRTGDPVASTGLHFGP